MHEFHDDHLKGKGSKGKDNDIDININVTVNKDGERCFDKTDSSIGAAAAGSFALNLCDVASGIRDMRSALDDASPNGDWSGRGNGGGWLDRDEKDARHKRHERDEQHEGHEHQKQRERGAAGRLGDTIDFNPIGTRDAERGFIDCRWDRILEANKVSMLHQYEKIGAVLRGTQG